MRLAGALGRVVEIVAGRHLDRPLGGRAPRGRRITHLVLASDTPSPAGRLAARRGAERRWARMPVVACGPGLRHLIPSQTEPVERIEVVRNGLPEIVERMLAGWVHLRP